MSSRRFATQTWILLGNICKELREVPSLTNQWNRMKESDLLSHLYQKLPMIYLWRSLNNDTDIHLTWGGSGKGMWKMFSDNISSLNAWESRFATPQFWVAQFAQVSKNQTKCYVIWMNEILSWEFFDPIKFTNLNMSSQIVFLRPKVPNLGWWNTWNHKNLLKSFSSACLVGGLLSTRTGPLILTKNRQKKEWNMYTEETSTKMISHFLVLFSTASLFVMLGKEYKLETSSLNKDSKHKRNKEHRSG